MISTAPFDAVAADLYPDPASICDWAVEQCCMVGLPPQNCQRVGCSKYIHHVCSIEWVDKNKLPEGGIAHLCRAHHPHYQKFVAAASAATASTARNTITSREMNSEHGDIEVASALTQETEVAAGEEEAGKETAHSKRSK